MLQYPLTKPAEGLLDVLKSVSQRCTEHLIDPATLIIRTTRLYPGSLQSSEMAVVQDLSTKLVWKDVSIDKEHEIDYHQDQEESVRATFTTKVSSTFALFDSGTHIFSLSLCQQ